MTTPQADPRRLSSTEITYLLAIVHLVRSAPDPVAARIARAAATAAAKRYRQRGVPWTDLADVYGVSVDELRQWRAEATTTPTRSAIRRPGTRATAPAVAGQFSFFAGNTQPNGNRFEQEAAQVRDHAHTLGTGFQYIPCVELQQINTGLERDRPLIAHLAAHTEQRSVFLSTQGEPMPVTFTMLVRTIRKSAFVPALIALNMCDSYTIAIDLNNSGYTVIGWPQRADDGQCQYFATSCIDRSHRASHSPTPSTWPP
jgi:hypothetical protein